MADDNKTDDDTTKATTKAAPRKAAKLDPVLLFNARLGPQVTNHTHHRKGRELPKGSGKDDPVQRFDVVRIMVPPGLYLMKGEEYAIASVNDGFKGRVAENAMVVVTDDASTPWEDQWLDSVPRVCIQQIRESGHVETLKALLDIEERDKVAAALQAQLMAVADESVARRNARNAQRAHNRESRRNSRTARVLDS